MRPTILCSSRYNRRRAYTLVETLLSFAAFAIMMVAALSVVRYLNNSALRVSNNAFAENYIVSVAETIAYDLESGEDITAINYNEVEELKNESVKALINVYCQEDVFGETLYQVVIDATYDLNLDRKVTRFFLRKGGS